jgi:hypothetical protein
MENILKMELFQWKAISILSHKVNKSFRNHSHDETKIEGLRGWNVDTF